ncbi:Rhodanese-related sulfurtransferase [Duganella sp. CF517]|uniref:rhodanese-like domain-containing protein n=1 Tax=Duganella sp. CF517 TaxID=1881038 RepID=UPI0008AD4F0A|nr:rhodanese-like domain-containing protein [Duganella sp. CF517]SEO44319.1 Rhodanese-related sulfurtransferase [Duganella sp. CF517]
MKFFIDNIFIIAVVVLSGGALLWPLLTQRGKRATPQDVTMLINRSKATIVDVRDAKEFANGSLPDAKNIPLAELDQRIGELDKFKSKSVVVVCQSGARASSAAAKLSKAGFTDVVNLEGGIAAWQKSGLPLAKPSATPSKPSVTLAKPQAK